MTVVLVLVAAVALWRFPRPPLAAVLVGALWLAVMDVSPLLLGGSPNPAQRSILSALAGTLVLAAAYAFDGRTARDHAGWLYVAGLVLLWGGIACYRPVTEPSLAAAATVFLWLVPLALYLRRPSFAIAGGLGLASTAGRATALLLEDEAAPFVYAAVALLLAGGALLWERRAAAWGELLVARLPPPLRRALPPARHR